MRLFYVYTSKMLVRTLRASELYCEGIKTVNLISMYPSHDNINYEQKRSVDKLLDLILMETKESRFF